MKLTFFSLCMAVFWSTVLVIVMLLLRRNKHFVKGFGVFSLSLLYIFCAARMLFAFEFPFTYVIPARWLYNDIVEIINLKSFNFGKFETNLQPLLTIAWLIGALVSGAIFIITYIRDVRKISKYEILKNDKILQSMERTKSKYHKNINASVFYCPEIKVATGVGIVKKKILLPCDTYSDEELDEIIGHEYMHFLNGDLAIKMLVKILNCIFWWNPFIHLLRADLSQLLEIKCDLSIVEKYDKQERVRYMKVITRVIKNANNEKEPALSAVTVKIADSKASSQIKERFEYIISAPLKDNEKQKKNNKIFKYLCLAIFAIIFVISYSFTFQSSYDPSDEEMGINEGAVETTL